MPDTVSPYDDEVRDPYEGDDVKNPHEDGEGPVPEPASPAEEDTPGPAKKAAKSTRTTKKT